MAYLRNETEVSLTNTKNNTAFYRLDGVDDYISWADNANLNFTGDFTIIFQKEIISNASYNQRVIAKSAISNPSNAYEIIVLTTGKIQFLCIKTAGSDFAFVETANVVADSKEHCVCWRKITNDKNNWKVNIDGVSTNINGVGTLTGFGSNSYPLTVGTLGTTFAKGKQGKILYFNYAISDDKMQRYTRGEMDWEDIGGSNVNITSGNLTIGKKYRITVAGGTFTGVGAVDNNIGTEFMATGTTPTWGTGAVIQLGCTFEAENSGITNSGWYEKQNGLKGTLNGGLLASNLPTPYRQTDYMSIYRGANVASATTITPTGSVFHVTGTTAIATINIPYTNFNGQIMIIPDGIFTTTTAGNIALASTAVVSRTLTMTYDNTTAKWYPSY